MYPNLKLQLWRKGFRQNQLARLLNIDETIVSRIVNGFRPATPEIRERIARLLGADETWLFDNVNPATPADLGGPVESGSL
jgi:transcriptional regulator with XRE-family HTH domain